MGLHKSNMHIYIYIYIYIYIVYACYTESDLVLYIISTEKRWSYWQALNRIDFKDFGCYSFEFKTGQVGFAPTTENHEVKRDTENGEIDLS